MDTGDPDRAIDTFTRALAIDPTLAMAYCNRASAFTARGRLNEAVADLKQAVALDPQSPPFHSNLALAYSRLGDYGKAIAYLEQTAALDPGMGSVFNNLAWLLATCPDAKFRDGQRALTAATMACKLSDWKDPVSLDTFAAACAEAGDFNAAVKWEQNAIAQPGLSPGDLGDAQKRLALYQAHKTYTEDPRTAPSTPSIQNTSH
jgi:tetratricopeptide (TPR) repeat protein